MKEEQIRHSMISVRDKYIEIIRSELLGPGSEFDIPDKEHELISSSPLSRYTIGILFPKENLIEQDMKYQMLKFMKMKLKKQKRRLQHY